MFPVFIMAGLLPWNFANEAVSGGARSVIENAALIKKVFFPREVLPLVAVLSSLVNFVLSLPMLLVMMAAVQLAYAPLRVMGSWTNFSWTFGYLPVLLVIQTLFLAGVALFLSALAVRYRDTVHLIGILLQFWFFLTPVVYSLERVAGPLAQAVRWLNPMASLVEFYREVLYGNVVAANQIPTPNLPALDSVLRVLLTAFATLALGYWYFQRRSGEFGERL
jgi:lipopolysaccharide transport system permease protein